MLLKPELRVIALRRRNLLQQVVSGFIAGQTGIWQGITDKARLEYDKWQDRYSQEYKEKAEKLRKEMESLSEKAMKEAKEKSEKAQKLLRTSIKKYRGIKV